MQICFFDIDGTLLSSGGAGKSAMEAAMSLVFGAPPDCSRGVSFSGRTDRAIARDLFERNAIRVDEDTWELFRQTYLNLLPEHLRKSCGAILPGMKDLVEALADRTDVLLGLLTGNVVAGARLKLDHFRIGHHFAFGGFGDRHWERDEVAREALQSARAHLGREIAPETTWVIGDTPMDVRCARAIGARAIAVATGGHPEDELRRSSPDLLLSDLSDPKPLLRMMFG